MHSGRVAACVALLFLPLTAAAAAGPRGDVLVRSRALNELFAVSPAGEVTATLVAGPLGATVVSVAQSPDGAHIAFVSRDAGETAVFVADADGARARAVARSEGAASVSAPVWVSPDELAFHRFDPGPSHHELWVVDVETGVLRRLAVSAFSSESAVMQPNGTLLAYTAVERPGVLRRALVDVRSGVSQLLPASTSDVAWSPDGRELALAGPVGLRVLRADGSGMRTLLTGREVQEPAWSPDGRRIAFAFVQRFFELSGRSGVPARWDVYTVGADGTGVTRLTGVAGDRALVDGDRIGSTAPVWWPDGSRLFFRALRADDTVPSIWMMNAEGSCEMRWAAELKPAWPPSWRAGTAVSAEALGCVSVILRLRNSASELGVRQALPLSLVVRNDGTRSLADLSIRLETNLGSVEVGSCGRGRNVTCPVGRLDPGQELRLPAKIASRTTGDVRLVAAASYTGGTDVSPHDHVAVARFHVAPCDLVGTWRNDRLTGTPARDWICGRRGDDRIDGGRGNDVIEAGSGRDTVLGGPGRDRVDAGGNADRVLTRDGERDIVDCGGERDTAIVDRSLDVVSRCEVVRG